MTVFSTFWKLVKKHKGMIILYTVMLVLFGSINMSSNNQSLIFTASKPDVLIVNNDVDEGITRNLIDYVGENANLVDIKDNEGARDDALFYRDVSYIIYIPSNYRNDVLSGKNPILDIKSALDYEASFMEMMLKRYIKIQNIYANFYDNESDIIGAINSSLLSKSKIDITAKVDTSKTERMSFYFNFASYSIMAVILYIISLVLTSFYEHTINKRIVISSMDYRRHNYLILVASFTFSVIIWLLYYLLSYFILGNIVFTELGLICALNLFIFTFCSLTLALLITSLIKNKNAISGIVNVVALGSAFLCGCFIPAEMLPNMVLKIAHFLPTYWYINSNDLVQVMETVNIYNVKPILVNMSVMLVFSLLFICLNNMAIKYKLKG